MNTVSNSKISSNKKNYLHKPGETFHHSYTISNNSSCDMAIIKYVISWNSTNNVIEKVIKPSNAGSLIYSDKVGSIYKKLYHVVKSKEKIDIYLNFYTNENVKCAMINSKLEYDLLCLNGHGTDTKKSNIKTCISDNLNGTVANADGECFCQESQNK